MSASRTGTRPSTRRNPEGIHAMPKFVIEREIPGIGRLPADSMRNIAQKS
jgi:hypothetical protein